MSFAPLYLDSSPREGYFNIPPNKKGNIFIKQEENKSAANKIVEKAVSDFKIQNNIKNEKKD